MNPILNVFCDYLFIFACCKQLLLLLASTGKLHGAFLSYVRIEIGVLFDACLT